MTSSMEDPSSAVFCARRLKVLADPTRLAVLRMLLWEPKRVGEINASLGLEQSLLSHHLKILRDERLVVAERDGKGMRYRLAPGVARKDSNAIDIGCCLLEF